MSLYYTKCRFCRRLFVKEEYALPWNPHPRRKNKENNICIKNIINNINMKCYNSECSSKASVLILEGMGRNNPKNEIPCCEKDAIETISELRNNGTYRGFKEIEL